MKATGRVSVSLSNVISGGRITGTGRPKWGKTSGLKRRPFEIGFVRGRPPDRDRDVFGTQHIKTSIGFVRGGRAGREIRPQSRLSFSKSPPPTFHAFRTSGGPLALFGEDVPAENCSPSRPSGWRFELNTVELTTNRCGFLGLVPSPHRGEGQGEGQPARRPPRATVLCPARTPHPGPLPEGARGPEIS